MLSVYFSKFDLSVSHMNLPLTSPQASMVAKFSDDIPPTNIFELTPRTEPLK